MASSSKEFIPLSTFLLSFTYDITFIPYSGLHNFSYSFFDKGLTLGVFGRKKLKIDKNLLICRVMIYVSCFKGIYISNSFYFLITYGVCKKRKYCNRMSEKKNSLLLTNVHDLYVLEDKTSQKKFPSIWMYVRTWTFHVDTITFEGVSGYKQNLVGVFCV